MAALARSIQSTWRAPQRFQAKQAVIAGDLRVEANVRREGERSLEMTYTHLTHPWGDIEALLSGFVEHTPAELLHMQFRYDGMQSWRYSPSTQTVVRTPGRVLFEPIPGTAFFGEFGFLAHLSRDFLIRDLGDATHAGRSVRRIRVKPKMALRPSLLSAAAFPVQRATIDLDPKTWFPLRVSWTPSEDSTAAALLGAHVPITVESEDVQPITADAPSIYTPPHDARTFDQSSVALGEALDMLPFAVSLTAMERLGWDPNVVARLTLDQERGRAFLTAHLSPRSETQALTRRSRLSITVGNYVSASMARWRSLLSERGSNAPTLGWVRTLDRRIVWEEALSGLEQQPYAPVDAFFQQGDLFWFVSLVGEGASLEALEQIAQELTTPSTCEESAGSSTVS